MGKRKPRDYEHQQVEITGFPKEEKPHLKIKVREKLLAMIKTKKKMKRVEILYFFGYSGYANVTLNDLLREGIIKTKKFDCGTCEYFELAKE